MKKLFTSYTSFTRTEKIGLVCLCTLLVALLAIRVLMPLLVHPTADTEKEKELVAAWEAYKRSQPKPPSDSTQPRRDFQDAGDEQTTALPDSIDINTADSATLVRLKGIGPVTASKIIKHRTTKGPFTNIDQLHETGGFSKENLALLKKHLIFGKPEKNK